MAADPDIVKAIITAGGLLGGGVMMAGGAIGAGIGDGMAARNSSRASRASPKPNHECSHHS